MEKVSVICAVMNRNERVESALINWLGADGVDEIVLIDWSSKVRVCEVLPPQILSDPRVKLYRVKGEERWILTHAFNLAASLAKNLWLAKLDIDYRIEPEFFESIDMNVNSFIRGNWSVAMNYQDRFLTGFVLVSKIAFLHVNGYNENIVTYGYEDLDLYERLVCSGYSGIDLVPVMIEHLTHDDDARLANQDVKNRAAAIKANEMLAKSQRIWRTSIWRKTGSSEFTRDTISKVGHTLR